jgi:hypothetical protein
MGIEPLDTQCSEDLAPRLRCSTTLIGASCTEGWTSTQQARTQRNRGAERENGKILGRTPSSQQGRPHGVPTATLCFRLFDGLPCATDLTNRDFTISAIAKIEIPRDFQFLPIALPTAE